MSTTPKTKTKPKSKSSADKRERHGLRDLKGQQIGDLLVLGKVPTPITMRQRWRCACVCGTIIVVGHADLIHTNHPKTHCGCRRKGLPTLEKSTYIVWQAMMSRCHNEKHTAYAYYGGRGITVCEEWKTFEGFFKGMGRRPSKQMSLDRIDPNKGYEPGNVRWATNKQQARNKRQSVLLPHPKSGVMLPAADIAESLGIGYHKFRHQMILEGKWLTKPKPE